MTLKEKQTADSENSFSISRLANFPDADSARRLWRYWIDDRCIDAVISALSSDENEISIGASLALGYMKEQRAVPYLLRELLTTDANRAEAIAWALGEIKDEAALPYLHRAIEANFITKSALVALGKIGSAKSVDIILRSIHDQDQIIRTIAAKALASIRVALEKQHIATISVILDSRMKQETSRQVKLLLAVAKCKIVNRHIGLSAV